jgi:hypothetical protein
MVVLFSASLDKGELKMFAKDVTVGRRYNAKILGRIQTVRILRIVGGIASCVVCRTGRNIKLSTFRLHPVWDMSTFSY